MRIVAWVAAAAALLIGAPVALAHEGSPNFLSQINEVTPAAAGVDVEVLNRDDRLLLRNNGTATVLIEGYDGEPYARIEPDGTVSVNTDSKAYYINEERDGEVEVPDGVDGKGEPRWEELSRTGRFEWHDHRMHWMSESDPEAVTDKDVTVDPARVGPNEMHVYLFNRRDGRQYDETLELTVTAELPERRIEPIEFEATKAGPGHFLVSGAAFGVKGDWTVEIAARISDFDEFRTKLEVPVR